MKRLFFAAVLFSASTVTFAQESAVPATSNEIAPVAKEATSDAATDERKEIKIADLPAAIRTELNTTQYKGWSPSTAWWIREGKSEFYEITLVMGDESKKVKYNAEGSKLD